MKNLFFAFAVLLGLSIYAQVEGEKVNTYLRVYDLHSNLLHKGKLLSISETSLQLKGKKGLIEISANTIGLIKTGRATGHNVLIGAAVGATVGGIYGGVSNSGGDSFFTTSQGAELGIVFGGVAGAAIGGISTVFKKNTIYLIDGDKIKWMAFKKQLHY